MSFGPNKVLRIKTHLVQKIPKEEESKKRGKSLNVAYEVKNTVVFVVRRSDSDSEIAFKALCYVAMMKRRSKTGAYMKKRPSYREFALNSSSSNNEPLGELRKKLLQQKSLSDGKHLSWIKMGCFVPPGFNFTEPEDTAYEKQDRKIENYIRLYFDDSVFGDISYCTNVKIFTREGKSFEPDSQRGIEVFWYPNVTRSTSSPRPSPQSLIAKKRIAQHFPAMASDLKNSVRCKNQECKQKTEMLRAMEQLSIIEFKTPPIKSILLLLG
nr:unnamed protein product [Callosobruchus analis]